MVPEVSLTTQALDKTSLTCLSRRALAVETAHAVNAGRSVETGCACTVVNVERAVRACPAVDANTGEPAH